MQGSQQAPPRGLAPTNANRNSVVACRIDDAYRLLVPVHRYAIDVRDHVIGTHPASVRKVLLAQAQDENASAEGIAQRDAYVMIHRTVELNGDRVSRGLGGLVLVAGHGGDDHSATQWTRRTLREPRHGALSADDVMARLEEIMSFTEAHDTLGAHPRCQECRAWSRPVVLGPGLTQKTQTKHRHPARHPPSNEQLFLGAGRARRQHRGHSCPFGARRRFTGFLQQFCRGGSRCGGSSCCPGPGRSRA